MVRAFLLASAKAATFLLHRVISLRNQLSNSVLFSEKRMTARRRESVRSAGKYHLAC